MRAERFSGGLVILILMHLTACGGGGGGGSDGGGQTAGVAGQLQTAAVGVPFEFTPGIDTANGDDVTYSIANQPPWATFDPATGRLEGTPPPGSEGVYQDVIITAGSGNNATSVELTIEVVSRGDASISLSWTAPLENEDGSFLSDLAGYVVYYGTSPGSYDASVRIDNPGLSTYVLEGLTPGTYYLAATAFNSAGVESRFSNEVARVAK